MEPERLLSPIERDLLEYFFRNAENLAVLRTSLETVEVEGREFTGVGFFVTLAKCSALYVGHLMNDCTWGDVSAKLNDSVDVGFLVFVVDGYVDALEGFAYGEGWPEHVSNWAMGGISLARERKTDSPSGGPTSGEAR